MPPPSCAEYFLVRSNFAYNENMVACLSGAVNEVAYRIGRRKKYSIVAPKIMFERTNIESVN